jgi:hypothetical protein
MFQGLQWKQKPPKKEFKNEGMCCMAVNLPVHAGEARANPPVALAWALSPHT